ncbi:MAG: hypothetical protein KC492_18800 [Myxococcales bacterium]|nr:hypothetical protein [Myxococcales bacterium]
MNQVDPLGLIESPGYDGNTGWGNMLSWRDAVYGRAVSSASAETNTEACKAVICAFGKFTGLFVSAGVGVGTGYGLVALGARASVAGVAAGGAAGATESVINQMIEGEGIDGQEVLETTAQGLALGAAAELVIIGGVRYLRIRSGPAKGTLIPDPVVPAKPKPALPQPKPKAPLATTAAEPRFPGSSGHMLGGRGVHTWRVVDGVVEVKVGAIGGPQSMMGFFTEARALMAEKCATTIRIDYGILHREGVESGVLEMIERIRVRYDGTWTSDTVVEFVIPG